LCDSACQRSSNSALFPGSIANFLQLRQSSNNWFIRVGYETTAIGTQYFYNYHLDDQRHPDATGLVGATGIEPGYTGDFPFIHFAVWSQVPSGSGGRTDWGVRIDDETSGASGRNINFTEIGLSAFVPDQVQYAQVVVGTSGATALGAVFTNNTIWTNYLEDATPYVARENGTVTSPVTTATNPTDAGWLFQPSGTRYGGMFFVSCCQPLS
jgi:hypothetical protein